MKKTIHVLTKIAIVCMIVGAIMVGGGVAMGGTAFNAIHIRGNIFNFNNWDINDHTMEKQSTNVEDFHSIDLAISYGDIQVVSGNKYELIVEGVPEDEYTIEQENGVLTIKQTNATMFNIGFDYDYNFTIVVPDVMKDIRVDCAMGDIEIENITISNLDVFQKAGKVDINNVNIDNSVMVDQKMGDIEFHGVFEGTAEFSNAMGDIDIEIEDREADYQYDLATAMGSLKVNGKKKNDGMNASYEDGNGKHRITADNKMGDISLEFR